MSADAVVWVRPTVKAMLRRNQCVCLTVRAYYRNAHLHRPRLEAMIAHLKEVDRRDPASFDLSMILVGDPEQRMMAVETWQERWAAGESLNCGTTACLVGHLPLVFPDHFIWTAGQAGWVRDHTNAAGGAAHLTTRSRRATWRRRSWRHSGARRGTLSWRSNTSLVIQAPARRRSPPPTAVNGSCNN